MDFKEGFFKIIYDSINEEEDSFNSIDEDDNTKVDDSLGHCPPSVKDPPEIHKKCNKCPTAGKGDLTIPTGKSYIKKGGEFLEEEKYNKAMDAFLKAKKDKDYLIEALFRLTYVYGIKGEFDEAIKCIDEAMSNKSVNINLFSKLKDFILLKKNKKNQ